MIEKKTKKSGPKKKTKIKKSSEKVTKKVAGRVDDLKRDFRKQSLDKSEASKIIQGHIDSIGQHPLTKGMRVEKIAFSVFLALPESIRGSQIQFASEWGISENTLCLWKADSDVNKLRLITMKKILVEKTPAVLDNLFEAASRKNALGTANTSAIKLWLQFTEQWEEASRLNIDASGGFTVNFGAGKSQFINPEEKSV